ncbi:MAG TPA: DinB family protein [Microscillaceae bacterium]|nr:DinB family protein [Microscillaceae bacterium]
MNSIDLILLNFAETRRRSIKLWQSIPEEHWHWKPDEEAFSVLEMIRHVLETEHLFHTIVQNRGNLGDYPSPWENLPYQDLQHELDFAQKYREALLNMIKDLQEADLENIIIRRTEVGQVKKLGDYLNRMVYHEAIHTGQMQIYMRALNIDRSMIWD